MPSVWYYAKGNNRSAPVSLEELQRLVATREVTREDRVWTDGMTSWSTAGTISELQFPDGDMDAPMAVQPIAEPVVAMPIAPDPSIAYYNPTGSLPPRAAETLRNHARPTGDIGDWPLDDAHVLHFEDALKHRKRITSAANLYKGLMALSIIAFVIIFLVGFGTVIFGGGRSTTMIGSVFLLLVGGMLAGFSILYYFCWRATARSKRWAPLTMFILNMVSVALNLVSMMIAMASPRPDPPVLFGEIFGSILPIIFGVISWRAFAAIPLFLNKPAWCQELLIKAKL